MSSGHRMDHQPHRSEKQKLQSLFNWKIQNRCKFDIEIIQATESRFCFTAATEGCSTLLISDTGRCYNVIMIKCKRIIYEKAASLL